MSKSSFENSMSQIGKAAESQQIQELAAQKRRNQFEKIRRVIFLFISMGLIGAGLYFHKEIQTFASDKLGIGNTSPKIDAQTSKSLNALQEGATKRDSALDEIIK